MWILVTGSEDFGGSSDVAKDVEGTQLRLCSCRY